MFLSPRGDRERPKIVPRPLQDRPRTAQERPKTAQERLKTAQERPKTASRRPKSDPRATKTTPRPPKSDFTSFPRAKTTPRGSKINLSEQEREARDFQRSIVADFLPALLICVFLCFSLLPFVALASLCCTVLLFVLQKIRKTAIFQK